MSEVGNFVGDATETYGKILLWKHIAIGCMVVLCLSILLHALMRYHHNYQKTTGTITGDVACQQINTGTETVNGVTKPLVAYSCVAPIKFTANAKKYDATLTFTQSQLFPKSSKTIDVEYDPNDPTSTVERSSAFGKIKPIVELVVFVMICLAFISSWILYKLRNNRTYMKVEGGMNLSRRAVNFLEQ